MDDFGANGRQLMRLFYHHVSDRQHGQAGRIFEIIESMRGHSVVGLFDVSQGFSECVFEAHLSRAQWVDHLHHFQYGLNQ